MDECKIYTHTRLNRIILEKTIPSICEKGAILTPSDEKKRSMKHCHRIKQLTRYHGNYNNIPSGSLMKQN